MYNNENTVQTPFNDLLKLPVVYEGSCNKSVNI